MVDGFAKRPRYILKEGSHPTCPSVSQATSKVQATVIYGFSDKAAYDVFLAGSSLALTPYPLVQRFLENQIDLDSHSLKLVALDATSPTQRCLYAATFQAVLESFHLGAESVAISHRMVLEEASPGYRLEAFSASGFVGN